MTYHLGVNFKWGENGVHNVTIKRSEFDELQNLLKKMSNNKFKFHYTTQSLTMDKIDIVPDPESPTLSATIEKLLDSIKSNPKMGDVERECRLRVLEIKAQTIIDEVRCIRNND
jgi:hypothetical protein